MAIVRAIAAGEREIYRLLRWARPYVDEGAEAHEKRYKEVRVKSLTAAAKDLGYQLTPAATQL
jgi:hypothetical protein